MDDDEWVPQATRLAMVRILDHAEKVCLANTEEFTFRSFFMAAAYELLDRPRFQTEWGTFDLLVQTRDTSCLIEFKYYLRRRTYRLDGTPGRRKGGAGVKNEAEFRACVDKLRAATVSGIDQRRLVLVYEREDQHGGTGSRSFHDSYGRLEASAELARVWRVSQGRLEARIVEPAPVA